MDDVEVILFRDGRRVASATADVADAIYAGQVIHDDEVAATIGRGVKLSVGFYVDGKLSVLVDGRPA